MGTGASFGNPKSKLQLAAIFATRDQFAKYILIRHRVSYNIYVDEGNLGKAIAHAINKNKVTMQPELISSTALYFSVPD